MFALKIWTEKGRKTTFYSVWKEDNPESETNRFFRKYKDIRGFEEAARILMNLIVNDIGNRHGARKAFFNRDEEGAFGLPPKGEVRLKKVRFHFPEFPLRLYALRINEREDIVVLFNGGIKSSGKNIDSRDLHVSMQEAKAFVKRIDEALRSDEILIDEDTRELTDPEGNSEIILY